MASASAKDDATQELVDGLRAETKRFDTRRTSDIDALLSQAADALEAAQRPPAIPSEGSHFLAFRNNDGALSYGRFVMRGPEGSGAEWFFEVEPEAVEAIYAEMGEALRPPVSPEAREEVQAELDRHEYAGNNMCECGESMGGSTDGVTWTIETNAHVTDALLARFSFPSQPAYDEEKVADWFATFAVQTNPYGLSIPIDQAHEAAAALVAALRGGELTREERP